MSAMWMPASGGPGQTWGGAAASFVAMWVPMMAAMKLPSLVSTLLRRLRNSGKQNNEHNDPLEHDRHPWVRPRQRSRDVLRNRGRGARRTARLYPERLRICRVDFISRADREPFGHHDGSSGARSHGGHSGSSVVDRTVRPRRRRVAEASWRSESRLFRLQLRRQHGGDDRASSPADGPSRGDVGRDVRTGESCPQPGHAPLRSSAHG